jgi:hypothetical protein
VSGRQGDLLSDMYSEGDEGRVMKLEWAFSSRSSSGSSSGREERRARFSRFSSMLYICDEIISSVSTGGREQTHQSPTTLNAPTVKPLFEEIGIETMVLWSQHLVESATVYDEGCQLTREAHRGRIERA